MNTPLLLALTIVTTSALVVAGVLLILAAMRQRLPTAFADMPNACDGDAVFVFHDDMLVDCSDSARQLFRVLTPDSSGGVLKGIADKIMAGHGRTGEALERLMSYLRPHFAGLDEVVGTLARDGTFDIEAQDGSGMRLSGEWRKGMAHLRLTDTTAEGTLIAIDRLSHVAQLEELQTLRSATRHVPVMIWQQDSSGQVIWANGRYIEAIIHSGKVLQHGLTWPLPALFAPDELAEGQRLELDLGDEAHWFSHHAVTTGSACLHFALPIDPEIRLEAAHQQMMQTLTKTFAALPIGLAVFDKFRKLQVFNPALVELTGLDPIMLAGRPSFESVLHGLRELRMLPEKPDFAAWRRELMAMEKAAESGVFSEEWVLASGRTFQVTGRPQHDGAIAFFLEDVTADVSLARSFRAELDTAQAVFDTFPDPIAVFAPDGSCLMVNSAYMRTWRCEPTCDVTDLGIHRAIALWAETCEPSRVWDRVSRFVFRQDPAERLSGTLIGRDGTLLAIRVERLATGAAAVTFRSVNADSQDTARHALAHRARLTGAEPTLTGISARPAQQPGDGSDLSAGRGDTALLDMTKPAIGRGKGDGAYPQKLFRNRATGVRHSGNRGHP